MLTQTLRALTLFTIMLIHKRQYNIATGESKVNERASVQIQCATIWWQSLPQPSTIQANCRSMKKKNFKVGQSIISRELRH